MNEKKKFSPDKIIEKLSVIEQELIDGKIENLDENKFLEEVENKIDKDEFTKEHIAEIISKIKKIRANIVLVKEKLNEDSKKLLEQRMQFSNYIKSSNLVK